MWEPDGAPISITLADVPLAFRAIVAEECIEDPEQRAKALAELRQTETEVVSTPSDSMNSDEAKSGPRKED